MDIPKKTLNDGVEIPVLGFGTWQLEGETCVKAVKLALELGYRHIDGAYAYWNHKLVRAGIGEFPREKLFMTSKLWRDFHSPELVEKCLDESLGDLGMDYLDLFLIHWPERAKSISSILEQMFKLKDKGKIKSVGLCNATAHHIKDIYNDGLTVSVNQIEYNALFNQNDLLDFCKSKDIAVTGYSPIAQGAVFRNEVIKTIASSHNKTAAQVSLRWLIQKDIIAIPKGSSKEHIAENLAIFDFKLTDDEMAQMEQINTGKRRINPDFNEFDY